MPLSTSSEGRSTQRPQTKRSATETGERQRIELLIAQARSNEQKLRRFQSFELRLIELDSLSELIQTLLNPPHSVFKWDILTLTLLDPDYEIRRALDSQGVELADYPNLSFAATGEMEATGLGLVSLFPTLGPYVASRHAGLFPGSESRATPASVALLPLVRHGRLMGSLNIGSEDKTRFVRGMRADFFEHLAAVVAICLENATNAERLKRQGLTDTLTGVNNRRFFDQRLNEELEDARRSGQPLSCLLVDVDHFKRINDTYGHPFGDVVLRELAGVMRAQLRGGDVLARYGGEEFAVLLAGTETDGAAEIAERVRAAVAKRHITPPEGGNLAVTVSIGLVTFDPLVADGQTLDGQGLVGCADRALYDAKAGGRNRVVQELHASVGD